MKKTTTAEVKHAYWAHISYETMLSGGKADPSRDFDTWLNEELAKAWGEGADFQFVHSPFPATTGRGINPYREVK